MLPVILKEIQSVFLISMLRLLQNVSLNYHFTSYSFLVSIYSCSSYSLPSKKFTLILRASTQMPFRITTKNVLQFTSRRRTADSAKEKLKGKFLKGTICREGRWQQTSTRLQYRWLTQPKANGNVFFFDYIIKEKKLLRRATALTLSSEGHQLGCNAIRRSNPGPV